MTPSLLRQVLQGLVSAMPDTPDPPDSLTLAEALWLAPLLPVRSEPPSDRQPPEPEAEDPLQAPDVHINAPGGEAADPLAEERQEPADLPDAVDTPEDPQSPSSAPAPAAAPLLPWEALPREADADALRHLLPVWLEDPPLLGDSLALLRALVPFQAERVEGPQLRLDEEATVEAYVASCGPDGRGGCWQPVLVPIPEPRYELVLVIDGAPTMAIWQRLVFDLRRALSSCAVVRQLRLVRLAADGTVPPRQRRWCQPHPEGRRLLLLLSDCCGDAWWSGAMAERLADWGPGASRAVLQVLPGWMWPRTALGLGDELVLRNAGTASQERLLVDRQRWLSEKPVWLVAAAGEEAAMSTVVPVLRCEPEGLAGWSLLITGRLRQLCAGVRLPKPEALSREAVAEQALLLAAGNEDPEHREEAPAPAMELERLEEFEAMATPRARRLLRLLAAAPVLTLPVIRLVRQALLFGDRTPLATAEVLLGGVLQLCEGADSREGEPDSPEQWQFTMAPEVRERLLGAVEALDAVTVFNAVSRLVEERWNQFMPRGSFRAFLTDPYQQAPPELAGIEGFASVAAQVLERLGGDYAALARQLREGARKQREEPWPAEEFVFEEEEVATGAVLPAGFPSVQSFAAQTARLERLELNPLRFTTATIVPTPRFGFRVFGLGSRQLSISRREEATWCFSQPLGDSGEDSLDDAPALTLLKLPAGEFRMGSAEGEEGGYKDEKPLHRVELASFFMGQTPITQAQWREVARWTERPGERWGRELNPSPSRFQAEGKGEARLLEGEASTDQRPVERVSWEEAMEFCDRLSQRTGRSYTLPSEAQWEYACRAGTTTPFAFGETLTPELANYDGNYTYANGPKGEYREQTTPVGMFPANAWGLQDMHGNVWEWCLDDWHESYEGAPEDGSAWLIQETGLDRGKGEGRQGNGMESGGNRKVTGARKLLRGGSWDGHPRGCRSAYRGRDLPDLRVDGRGFRVCCLPQGPSLNT